MVAGERQRGLEVGLCLQEAGVRQCLIHFITRAPRSHLRGISLCERVLEQSLRERSQRAPSNRDDRLKTRIAAARRDLDKATGSSVWGDGFD